MHLVGDSTSAVPLHLRDAAGAPTPEALSFNPGDPTLISIAPSGYVTALRTEGPTEIGVWASATLAAAGRPAANTSVIRVLPQNYGVMEEGRVCGISGNPIRLGWNIEGNAWQNCFLVPFQQPRSPQWFVFHHELGHNFSWTSSLFARMLWIGIYSEGLASTLALVSAAAGPVNEVAPAVEQAIGACPPNAPSVPS
jgi:hypothetical protein